MAFLELIEKYKVDKNDTRLTILLESYGKKSTAKNIKALKLLIEDDDMESLLLFIGDKTAIKDIEDMKIEKAIQEEAKRPKHQDDLEIFVKKQLGDPLDPNSTGNKVLSGVIYNWSMKTHINPDVLMRKFAAMAGRDYVEIDYHPNFSSNPPIYECAILGTKVISRDRITRVN